jgi:hypothetical protein
MENCKYTYSGNCWLLEGDGGNERLDSKLLDLDGELILLLLELLSSKRATAPSSDELVVSADFLFSSTVGTAPLASSSILSQRFADLNWVSM